MRMMRIFLPVFAVVSLAVAQPLLAEGWSLEKLLPLPKKEHTKGSARKTTKQPSPLQRLDTGTKKFFAQVCDVLTFKKPLVKREPPGRSSWMRQPEKKQPEKKPFWSSWYAREEPTPPRSLREFMRLPRSDP